VPFDAISYLLAKKALARGIRLPTLADLVIDTDKDWQGHRIINLGEPVDPHDAARRIYVDAAATGLGINYYFLDAADADVPAYKQLSLTPPELSETYAEYTSNSAGDYEIGSWIAPADGIPVLRLGVYTTNFQAERVSGGIDVRFFFRLYERDSGGSETLIAESSLSDLVTDRRDVITSLILASDYEMGEGSRLVLKIYARYLSSGPSTTVRLYYQGDVRSRLATPTAKEILDSIYASIIHASRHALGGADELSLDASQIASGLLSVDRIPGLDASKIVSGVLDVARIPDLSRSKITDLFNTPFWDSIPDKPFDTLGSELLVSAGELQIAGIDASKIISGVLAAARIPDLDASKITSGVFALARIPNIDWTRISGNFPRSISDLISSSFSRSWISDLFSSPFWDNIPDKPSVFPPDLHAAAHGLGGADELSLDASQIASGTLSAARIPNLDASKITSGVFDVARIPDLARSKITDFFDSPFWDNIPDKPSAFPPSSHTHTKSDITDWAHEHYIKIGNGSATKITLQTNQNLHIVGSGNISVSYDDTNNKITITVTEGSGSGLDADTVDGKHASAFADTSLSNVSNSTILNKLKNVDGAGSGLDADLLDGKQSGNSSGQIPVSNGTRCVNLNADMVDGKHASAFALASHTHTISEITDIGDASVNYANSAGNADTVDGEHASAFTHARNGGQNIWVQSSAPTAQAVGDIWIQT